MIHTLSPLTILENGDRLDRDEFERCCNLRHDLSTVLKTLQSSLQRGDKLI